MVFLKRQNLGSAHISKWYQHCLQIGSQYEAILESAGFKSLFHQPLANTATSLFGDSYSTYHSVMWLLIL
jgi:hypothetical protein